MPKESIHDTLGATDVRVQWQPNAVQVGVETADGGPLVIQSYGDDKRLERIAMAVYSACQLSKAPGGGGGLHGGEQARELGRQILDIIANSTQQPHGIGVYTGFWATLDRLRVNQLIRTLRRARDDTYGPDA